MSDGVASFPFASSAWSRSVPDSRSSWPRGGHGGTRRAPTIARSTTLAGLRASSERIAGCIARASRNSMAHRFLESPREQRISARASWSAGFPLMWIRWIQRRRRSFASSALTGSVSTVEPLTPRPIAGRPRSRWTSPPAVTPALSSTAPRRPPPVPGKLRDRLRVRRCGTRAGGPTRRADLSAVNLAAPLADGQQVIVPRRGPTGTAATSAGRWQARR